MMTGERRRYECTRDTRSRRGLGDDLPGETCASVTCRYRARDRDYRDHHSRLTVPAL